MHQAVQRASLRNGYAKVMGHVTALMLRTDTWASLKSRSASRPSARPGKGESHAVYNMAHQYVLFVFAEHGVALVIIRLKEPFKVITKKLFATVRAAIFQCGSQGINAPFQVAYANEVFPDLISTGRYLTVLLLFFVSTITNCDDSFKRRLMTIGNNDSKTESFSSPHLFGHKYQYRGALA